MKIKIVSRPALILTLVFLLNTTNANATWLSRLGDWISQLWKPVYGAYSEGGSTNTGAPLTTFDRGLRSGLVLIYSKQ